MSRTTYQVAGRGGGAIARSLEAAIRSGELAAGDRLPPVRGLAAERGVSPTTAAAAYGHLRDRGLVSTRGRAGTFVRGRPALVGRRMETPPAGVRNLADGNPDPDLLPDLAPHLRRLRADRRRYGEPQIHPLLRERATADLSHDGVDARHLAVVGGALDGMERALAARLRPGDRVAVEDPAYSAVLDLLAVLGLIADPVPVDDEGMRAEPLERALARGARASVVTPRAQNPYGSALTGGRGRALRRLFDRHPDCLVVEDDHARGVAGAPTVTCCGGRAPARWVVIRSVAKSLGPDLRLAVVAGDPETIGRITDRQLLGTGWVSAILQELVARLWSDPQVASQMAAATARYAERRQRLLTALAARGLPGHGRSGLNVYIPVREEVTPAQSLLGMGWAVRGGEAYRLASPPGLRVTVATLTPEETERFADAFQRAVSGRLATPVA